jgi:peptidoglycan/xylan/chitin deacetylase (PgdA/CDA1 family)
MNLRYMFCLTALVLAGCNGLIPATATVTLPATPVPPTGTATALPLPSSTPTASVAPTPTWVVQGPGAVKVPILMYHHVEVAPAQSPYRVSAARFEDELRLLSAWEYTSIPTSMLIDAITKGASLPPRPVIITFDDANEDNYTTAFPIMQKYGFTGVLYVPYDAIGAVNYLTADQIKEMAAAGWEIGSHTLSHPDLEGLDDQRLRAEIVDSRKMLTQLLGVPIITFAYPFAIVSEAAVDYVRFAGYSAAMDAKGYTADQGLGNLYALQREEIRGSETAKTFIRFLPWMGDPSYLPTDTPTLTPTASRTPIPTYTQYPTRTPKASPTP